MKSSKYTIKTEIEKGFRIDTGNPNYTTYVEERYYRVYKNGKHISGFNSLEAAKNYVKKELK